MTSSLSVASHFRHMMDWNKISDGQQGMKKRLFASFCSLLSKFLEQDKNCIMIRGAKAAGSFQSLDGLISA